MDETVVSWQLLLCHGKVKNKNIQVPTKMIFFLQKYFFSGQNELIFSFQKNLTFEIMGKYYGKVCKLKGSK